MLKVIDVSEVVDVTPMKSIELVPRIELAGKLKKVALTAAMRKLLTILNTLIRTDQVWIDQRANEAT
ncbi:MAG: hypothetical protein R3C20_06440 [Planctomycetaceae bacterium]